MAIRTSDSEENQVESRPKATYVIDCKKSVEQRVERRAKKEEGRVQFDHVARDELDVWYGIVRPGLDAWIVQSGEKG